MEPAASHIERPAAKEALCQGSRRWQKFTTASSMGVSCGVYRRLKLFGVPRGLFQLLKCCRMVSPHGWGEDLCLIEYFCGVGAITTQWQRAGFPAVGYDILKDPLYNDLNASAGFLVALRLMLQLSDSSGLAWFATVCSTWVWMSRSSTGRSETNVMGNRNSQAVMKANIMTTRCALLILLACAKSSAWVLEQPSTSLMTRHPALQWVQELCVKHPSLMQWVEVSTWMGQFGGGSAKHLTLCSNRQWLFALSRPKPGPMCSEPGVVSKKPRADGSVAINGGPALKATQTYTAEFGEAVLGAYVGAEMDSHDPLPEDALSSDDDDSYDVATHAWEHGAFEDVLSFAGARHC